MQDSLEDYIRLSRQSKNEDETSRDSNEVFISSYKKKQCEAKAMQILEFCIDGKLQRDTFFQCLPHINHAYYQDIVEERAIIKLCGYPLCGKRIPDMPKKQFHISTKSNKVYDITERKNFCSNYCYKGSIHIKNQIDSGPLWLRNFEELPKFTLLHKEDRGLPGDEIDQGIIKAVKEPVFTPVGTFTEVLLDELVENEINPDKKPIPKKKYVVKPKKVPMKTISESPEERNLFREKEEIDLSAASDKMADSNKRKEKVLNETPAIIKNEIVATSGPAVASRKSDQKSDKKKHKKSSKINVESNLLTCFKDWINLETFLYIYGERKVKETLNAHKLSNYFESLKIAELQLEQQKKYLEICKNLQLRELAEEKFDNTVVGNTLLKPIPDYQLLKKENKKIDVKVKSFYSGVMNVRDDSNVPIEKGNESVGPPVVLPLIDSNSQTAMRRNVFLNSLNKTMQNLLQNLRVDPMTILLDVQTLVKTFKLKSHNVVFTPTVWIYIAIILLKILALKDKQIEALVESDACKEYFDLYLKCLPSEGRFIGDILEIVEDVDKFVQLYILRDDI